MVVRGFSEMSSSATVMRWEHGLHKNPQQTTAKAHVQMIMLNCFEHRQDVEYMQHDTPLWGMSLALAEHHEL